MLVYQRVLLKRLPVSVCVYVWSWSSYDEKMHRTCLDTWHSTSLKISTCRVPLKDDTGRIAVCDLMCFSWGFAVLHTLDLHRPCLENVTKWVQSHVDWRIVLAHRRRRRSRSRSPALDVAASPYLLSTCAEFRPFNEFQTVQIGFRVAKHKNHQETSRNLNAF